MKYLHTMIRIGDIDKSLNFFCNLLGMVEIRRDEYDKGRFTLIFLAAANDAGSVQQNQAPMLELTYNWPDENGEMEQYIGGRNFGHLAYRVDDIYAVCQKLMAGGVTINYPPRNGHMAFVKSPDGISIELLQKGDALAPCEPWLSMPNVGNW